MSILIGLDLRPPLAIALIVMLAACASGAPTRSSTATPVAAESLAANPSPFAGPVANKSCPAANSQISTDQSIEALTASQTAASAEQALQSFLGQYRGIRLVVLPFIGNQALSWDNLTDDDLPFLITYGKLFICEWAKYSQLWVNSSRITRVALVKNLGNLTRGPCKASGQADWNGGTLYQDVLCGAASGPVKQKHTLHHEFWHLTAQKYVDSAWVALNGPEFNYGDDGWDPDTGWAPNIRFKHPRPGFVSAYAMHDSYEDAAETYATMFVKEERADLVLWMSTDPILKSKVEFLKQFIASKDPAMNASYLERASQS